jgi:hypothetical protein
MLSALLIVIFSVIGEIDNFWSPAREHQVDWHFSRVTIGETVLFEKSVNS